VKISSSYFPVTHPVYEWDSGFILTMVLMKIQLFWDITMSGSEIFR